MSIYDDIKTNHSYIRYKYDVENITTNSLTLAYSYSSSNEGAITFPLIGFRSPSTQQILNNLPQWMQIRQDVTSNGWKLTNSWGMSLENVLNNVVKNITNTALVTTDITYPSNIGYVDVSSKDLLDTKLYRNLLFNSGFAIRDVSRTRLPAGWESYNIYNQDIYIDYLAASPATAALTSSTGQLKIGQSIILNNVLINNLTNSLYVKTNAGTVDILLHISIEMMDGTNRVAYLRHTSAAIEWVRIKVPIAVNKQVYRINYTVISNCSDRVSIAAPQVELEGISNWSNSSNDVLPYVSGLSRFTSISVIPEDSSIPKIPLFSVGTQEEFIDIGIPTRIQKARVIAKDLAPFATQAYGRKVHQLAEVIQTEWSIVEEQVVERSISPTIWDIYGRYDIRDLRYYEDLSYGTKDDTKVTITPIATAIRKDYLFIACKEEYLGRTLRTIKIVKPLSTPNGETYLESIIDFDLGLDFTNIIDDTQITDEEITSIGFSEVDPSWLVVNTSANIRHYYKMYFDYYYFNSNNNRVYTLEKYTNAKISVI